MKKKFTAEQQPQVSPQLGVKLESFQSGKAAYVELQERLVGLIEGDKQISQKIGQVEAMAVATEASWKAMARNPEVDQAQINADIERCASLRDEAAALRMTANARRGLQGPLVLQLAEARQALNAVPAQINAEHWQSLLSQTLSQKGLRESLLQSFVLTRALYLDNLAKDDSALAFCGGQGPRQEAIKKGVVAAFADELLKLFGGAEADSEAPVLAVLPNPVSNEVVVTSPVAMMKLRKDLALA